MKRGKKEKVVTRKTEAWRTKGKKKRNGQGVESQDYRWKLLLTKDNTGTRRCNAFEKEEHKLGHIEVGTFVKRGGIQGNSPRRVSVEAPNQRRKAKKVM